eukprot:jgi/Bigna1/138516/aug1.45_g13224
MPMILKNKPSFLILRQQFVPRTSMKMEGPSCLQQRSQNPMDDSKHQAGKTGAPSPVAPSTSRRLLILYGSQTGCACDVAQRVARESLRYHFEPDLKTMDSYNRTNLPSEELVVFIASTTGQAEAPANMQKFWRFLRRKDIPRSSLKTLKFTVFGLGDSSYPVYNAVARRLHQRLLDLGAEAFHPRGLGDDQDNLGYDEKLNPWLDGLWAKLNKMIPSSLKPLPRGRLLPPVYVAKVVTVKTAKKQKRTLSSKQLQSFSNRKEILLGEIIENRRLTAADHSQDVRHIVFDFANDRRRRQQQKGGGGERYDDLEDVSHPAVAAISFEPGDVLDVYPQNHRGGVLKALEQLGLDPNDMISIAVNEEAPRFLRDFSAEGLSSTLPSLISAIDLFTIYLDVFGTPGRYFFEVLAHFASDEMQKEKLEEFVSAEGQLDLYVYNQREKRTYLEHVLFYRLQTRLSLSFFSFLHGFIVVKIALNDCGNDDDDDNDDDNDAGSSRFQISRGDAAGRGSSSNNIYVFFGNRYRKKDFLYEKEWNQMCGAHNRDDDGDDDGNKSQKKEVEVEEEEEQRTISGFYAAFSRDTEKKVYVQHKLAEQKEIIWEVLGKRQGHFMLAGNAQKMPNDVRNQVREIVRVMGKMTEKEAKLFMLRCDV